MQSRVVQLLLPIVLAFVALSAAGDDEALDYMNCKSIYEVKSVVSDQCNKEDKKCVFKRGTSPTIKITFVPNKDVSALKAEIRSKLAGGTFSTFNLEDNNACTAGNLPCPLKAGQEYTYTQSVAISETYPLIDNVQVNWVLNDNDDAKEREVCIVFKAKIAD